MSISLQASRQFHQRYMYKYFVRTSFRQLVRMKSAHITLMKLTPEGVDVPKPSSVHLSCVRPEIYNGAAAAVFRQLKM